LDRKFWYNNPTLEFNIRQADMKRHLHRLIISLFCLAGVVALISCSSGGTDAGSSSSPSSATTVGTGTVGLLLTDKPADPSLFESINAYIERAELLGSDDNGRVELYTGPTKKFDLLRLKHESVPFTFKDNVPAGKYCKIRLTLEKLELVLVDPTADVTEAKLPGNRKLDLLVRGCFTVSAGETVTIQLDLDGGNSIHIVGNNKGFNFRPVVFVDVLDADFEPRLVRLEGEIARIDDVQSAFLLCDAVPVQHAHSLGCVNVHLGPDAAFFDNEEFAGAPRPLTDLLADDKLGKRVTVVGRARFQVPPYDDVDIPDGHLPPPGECKLWDVHLDPGQQSPPGDCEQLADQVTDSLVLVTHDGVVKDRHHPLMAVDALAVELGTFLQVEGAVATDASIAGFDMTVASGGPVITSDTLAVLFQQGDPGVNGTRIVSKSGELLQPTQVVVPLPVQVDGTLELVTGSDPLLKAALVILDKAVAGTEQVTGEVLTVGADSLTLAPDDPAVCNDVATSELFVSLLPDLKILTVTITQDASQVEPGGVLIAGQNVGMNGRCEPGGYATDNVVIVDDQRP